MTSYRSYEDYDTSSDHYDGTRVAVGVEIVLGVLAATGPALGEQRVLDVGCGTGNYLAALHDHLGHLFGLEYSAGMLRRARHKARGRPRIDLVRGSAFALPFRDACVDAVMFNQVVHHFDDGGSEGEHFPLLGRALRESLRVLRPGGAVLLNHATRRQIHDGYWWMDLIPAARDRITRRYIPVPALRRLLAEVGFTAVAAAVPVDGVLQSRDYLNLRGPLDERWRRGESTWALATPEELEAGLERLRAMLAQGRAETWLAEREVLRQQVGQTLYVWARRPGSA